MARFVLLNPELDAVASFLFHGFLLRPQHSAIAPSGDCPRTCNEIIGIAVSSSRHAADIYPGTYRPKAAFLAFWGGPRSNHLIQTLEKSHLA